LTRTALLIGEIALQKLQKSKVLIVGLGGVGKTDASEVHISDISKTYNFIIY
jgi:molybdopterin/thiamine biosynthesis adenylyltransferase